jgi:osmotically-inducible protein OsmY
MKSRIFMTTLATTLLLGAVGCGEQAQQTTNEAPRSAGTNAEQGATSASAPTQGSAGNATVATPNASQLTTQVKNALNKDPKIATYKLEVEALPENYIVVLKGKVPTEAEKWRAEQVAVDAINNPTFAIDNQLVPQK